MINNFLLVLSLSGFALGVMASYILLFSNKRYRHANRLLAAALACMISILLVTFLFVWNIDFYAYVYRFPSPLLYLLLPVSYLYIRTIVNEETRLNKMDGIHFLLPVFYFIEILPHYFSSYHYRLIAVRNFIKHPEKFIDLNEGVLPSFYNTMLLIVQATVYVVLIAMLLRKANRIKKGVHSNNATLFGWIKIFTILIGINCLPMLCFLLCSPPFLNYALQFILIMLTLSFLVITLYLFTQPEILYGISNSVRGFPEAQSIISHSNGDGYKMKGNHSLVLAYQMAERKSEFSNLERYQTLLQSYMHSQKPFLKQGYTINDLANETGIPQHHLSAMINRVYQMRFNEYLNRLRVDYISENFQNPEWEKLTLEGIAKQAGFSSRTTFFNTIKKTRGLTPSEYIAQVKKKN